MSIDEAAALKAVRDGLEGRNVPIVHEEIRVVLAMALERDALRARVAELERCAERAEADATRLREVLAQVRDAMLATEQEPDGDDDPRRPLAAAVWRALASAQSAEPTRNQCDGCAAGRPVDAHGMHRMSDGEGFACNYQQCQAHRYGSPTPRDMRVAEAVREAYDRAIIAHGRLAAGAIDLAAVAAKAVKP